MIIETTCNHLYSVRETGNPSLAHVWLGIEVKRSKGGFVPKARAREEFVRKEGSRIIEQGARA